MQNIKDVADKYFELQENLFEHCGYHEQWRIFPMVDERESIWQVQGGEGSGGEIHWGDSEEQLLDKEEGDFYSGEIYTQRHHNKWVFRGEKYTLALVDTHCDGNIYLLILDNEKELKE